MKSHASTLSSTPIKAASPRPAFEAEASKQPGRGSTMVKQDRPAPAPHPTPDIAGSADRAAFNAKWEAEKTAAEQARTQSRDQSREERKAAFIRIRTDPQTGGQIRSLHKTFNR